MFTYTECARMADAIYYASPSQQLTVEGRQAMAAVGCDFVLSRENAGALYRAGVWRKGGWMAFVVRGTVPKHWPPTNLIQDAEMKLLDAVPVALLRLAVADIEAQVRPRSGQRWIVVGHSLGGAVAQALGFLYGVPFVTFDAPGMRYDVMRRGWAKASAQAVGGVGSDLLSILPGFRQIYDAAYRATPALDMPSDAARAALSRATREPVDNAAKGLPDIERQLGFNIAHRKDVIHKLTGPPIGMPYREDVDFPLSAAEVPTLLRAVALAMPGVQVGLDLKQWATDALRYHDSKALADWVDGHNWGGECPVDAGPGAGGRVSYFAPSYMSAPGWEEGVRR